MSKREASLTKARIAGYHDDSSAFMRLSIEARISRPVLMRAWRDGVLARNAGVPCSCNQCKAK